ncbi:MAG: hypothetical protein M1820_002220 [Bogoriella megaspora]|nr:MAG: hypothetical protein M1820_002220 [Bogoriella megaspora]
MERMRQEHGFKRTPYCTEMVNTRPKQWKDQIRRWGLDTKNIKKEGKSAMIRKKREREVEEPTRRTRFKLHGRDVPEHKIIRFERTMSPRTRMNLEIAIICVLTLYTSLPQHSGLTCYTPPSNTQDITEELGKISSPNGFTPTLSTPSSAAAAVVAEYPKFNQRALSPPLLDPTAFALDWYPTCISGMDPVNHVQPGDDNLLVALKSLAHLPSNNGDRLTFETGVWYSWADYDCWTCKTLYFLRDVAEMADHRKVDPSRNWIGNMRAEIIEVLRHQDAKVFK